MTLRLARIGKAVGTDKIVFRQRVHAGARGSEAMPIQVNNRELQWIEHDKIIFRDLHARLGIEEYLPQNEQNNIRTQKRLALLQRATVMARKKLWQLSIADLGEAAALGGSPLSQREKSVLRRAFASKYGCAEIIENDDLVYALSGVARSGPAGARIVLQLANGLRWRVRAQLLAGKWLLAMRYFRALKKLKCTVQRELTNIGPARPHSIENF